MQTQHDIAPVNDLIVRGSPRPVLAFGNQLVDTGSRVLVADIRNLKPET